MYSPTYVSLRDGLDDCITYLIPTTDFELMRFWRVCVWGGVCVYQPNPSKIINGNKELRTRSIIENVFERNEKSILKWYP